ncbi:purine-cytosine permease [Botrytis cinerea]
MPFTKERVYDPEIAQAHTTTSSDQDLPLNSKETAIHSSSLQEGSTWYAKAHHYASRFGVESRGIERVPSDERSTAGMSQIGTLWLSANLVVSSFAIGALSYPVFHLGFVDTVLIILFVNLLGVIPVAFFSMFGPRFGLRQMVLIAIFNCLACIGWSAVNVIVGAQLFNAVNPRMPGWAGIIVIAAATFIITLFGYKIVHTYERYSWIPCLIIFLIVLGEFAHSGNFINTPMGIGKSETGACLSFAASIFGFSTGWTSYAADYTVYQPVDRSRKSIFLWTFTGLIFPLLFTEILGAAVATAMASNGGDNVFMSNYINSGIGGLLSSVLVPHLEDSDNFASLSSLSLSSQTTVRTSIPCLSPCKFFPRPLHAYRVSFGPSSEQSSIAQLPFPAIYEGIALSEHIFFKKGFQGYRPENHMDASRLPPGMAAMTAFLFGVMGAVLGMAQVWFTGPIGKFCGAEYGGDVGFELAFAFSSISYCGLRWLEIKRFGR